MKPFPTIRCIPLLALILSAALCPALLRAEEAKMLIRVDISQASQQQQLAHLGWALDIASVSPGRYVDIVLRPSQLGELDAAGLSYTTLMRGPWDVAPYRGKAVYHTYPTIRTELRQIAADHPGITRLDTIATAAQGGKVWCLKVSSNPAVDDNAKLGVLFMGTHHAREWMGMEASLYIANYLTNNYGQPGFDSVTTLVNNREFYIIPLVNPDGFTYDSGGYYGNGKMWRKNRHVNGGGQYGVDLNRGYDGAQDGDPRGDWGTSTYDTYYGVTTSPDSSQDIFFGFSPSGEPEQQAVMNLIKTHNIVTSISYHTYGQEFMWPLGYADSTVKKEPDSIALKAIGRKVAARMRKYDSTVCYNSYQSSNLYGTTGDSDDWIYGYGLYQLGRVIFPFTPEVDTAFYTPPSHIDSVCPQCKNGAIYLAWLADSIVQMTSPPPVLPPPITRAQGNNGTNFKLTWRRLNPAASASAYAVQELTAPASDSSTGENAADAKIALTNFSRSTTRKYQGTYSFYAGTGVYRLASIATVNPFLVTGSADSFRFYDYQGMTSFDRLYIEASADGRAWTLLGRLSGNAAAWNRRAFGLGAFAGKSVYLRIRYVSDGTITGDGVYIDNIYPAAAFGTAAVLDSTITDTTYTVAHATGTYYYRARGYNAKRGWGDWGQLFKVVAPLAVEMTSYSALPEVDGVRISWRTESETNCYRWEIGRSSGDAAGYARIALINGHGTTSQPSEYSLTDTAELEPGTYWYRIEETDMSGARSDFGPMTVTVSGRKSPVAYALGNCRPNPSHGPMVIAFALSQPGMSTLTVYNIMGQAVRTLVNQELKAGRYDRTWDGKDDQGRAVAGGMYFYRLCSGAFAGIKRAMILR